MPVFGTILDIVRILNEAGYGVLAGELLTEVSLGRELEIPAGDTGAEDRAAPAAAEVVKLDDDRNVERRYVDSSGGEGRYEAKRVPMNDREQLQFAAEFLRLRLIEPVRVWAEAEQIAGELAARSTEGDAPGKPSRQAAEDEAEPTLPQARATPVRIVFEPGFEGAEGGLAREAEPGSVPAADDLVKVLARIAALEG